MCNRIVSGSGMPGRGATCWRGAALEPAEEGCAAVAAIVLGLVLLVGASCARDDGLGDLHRGVRLCNEGGCNAPRR